MHTVFQKQLGLSRDLIYTSTDQTQIFNTLARLAQKNRSIIIFVEREVNRVNTTGFIKKLKQKYPDLYLVLLTSEVEKSLLIYLHEIGVNNFITKPLSLDTIVEKIAFTIRPPSKLGQLMDKCKDLLSEGHTEQALSTVEEILDMKPNSPAALMLQGDIYKQKGDKESAVQAY